MEKNVKKDLTTSLPQPYIVTMAVYLLDGGRQPVDSEDVAMKCHELAPGRFSWRKYPEQINLDNVRRNLVWARTPEFGSMLKGSITDGWTLTPSGLDWATKNHKAVESVDLRKAHPPSRTQSGQDARLKRERSRIRSTEAWTKWAAGDVDISLSDAQAVFRIDSYATGRMQDLKINRVELLFDGDMEIREFLSAARSVLDKDGDSK
ncbi:MAG: hypothetical protein OER97_02000 [Gammaproteobacteria bacterium]|nr:hypothetical protein [Gammaproteobacteria bacterium]